nr:MAG TPA: hypothetical protein [Caudoviricetes sp.]
MSMLHFHMDYLRIYQECVSSSSLHPSSGIY